MTTMICILHIKAEEAYSDRGMIGIQVYAQVTGGAEGRALCAPDCLPGRYESPVPMDQGIKYHGEGLSAAVAYINSTAAVKLRGMEISNPSVCDAAIRSMDLQKMGVLGAAALSEAIWKAAAQALQIPLYRYIGGRDVNKLPVPACVAVMGSVRGNSRQRMGGRPIYSFLAYGFPTFSEAVYGLWETVVKFTELLTNFLGFKVEMDGENLIPKGYLDDDTALLDILEGAIRQAGCSGRVGIFLDLAADHFYDQASETYCGLFSEEQYTREELMEKLRGLCEKYPIVLLQDPLQADDFAGFAQLRQDLPAAVVGNELFVSQMDRLKRGIRENACDGAALVIAHVGTVSDAKASAALAEKEGLLTCTYGVRGEDVDAADYAVGFGCDILENCGITFLCNRMLEIEQELGKAAVFAGQSILDPIAGRKGRG